MVTLERFKVLFLGKYFSRHMWNQMEIKFLELKQDTMSVADYEVRFTELARFILDQVDTDEKRSKRFQQGLKDWIRSRVAMFEMTAYVSIVQKAMIIENEMSRKNGDGKKKQVEASEGSQKQGNFRGSFNRRPEFQPNENVGFRRPPMGNGGQRNQYRNQSSQRSNHPAMPNCINYGGKNFGNCRNNVECYKCHQKGHYASECAGKAPGFKQELACFRCGKPGHMVKDCPIPESMGNITRISNPPTQRIAGPSN